MFIPLDHGLFLIMLTIRGCVHALDTMCDNMMLLQEEFAARPSPTTLRKQSLQQGFQRSSQQGLQQVVSQSPLFSRARLLWRLALYQQMESGFYPLPTALTGIWSFQRP